MILQDVAYLICTYCIIADEEIDINEVENQKKIFSPSEDVAKEHSKILSDAADKISLEKLIDLYKKANLEQKKDLFQKLFRMVYADKFYHPKEVIFIEELIIALSFPKEQIVSIQEQIGSSLDDKYKEIQQNWLENIKQAFYGVLYEINKDDKYETSLLRGKSFVNRVRAMAKKAKEDLLFTENKLYFLNADIAGNITKIKDAFQKIAENRRNDKESEELYDFVNDINTKVEKDMTNMLFSNLEMINKKKRTVDYFTIAFMGRTKAGKSTFHKVVTGEDTDDIGVGKLRTTRYNRVFNWENIRIVDTPGIGAPGGKTDTETARKIVDEADLICYVVTNDAIQETEFNFLSELKEKNKPIFIILNCKNDLEHKLRLRKFLENPTQWKEETGNKSIKGHIDRIHEMIQKNNYNSDFIEVIPIQLLAAQMSMNATENNFSSEETKKLHIGSNIDEYITKVKQTIFRTGNLKKSQNIIDGANYYVAKINNDINNDVIRAEKLLRALKDKKKYLNTVINKEKLSTNEELNKLVQNTHNQIKGDLKSVFAGNHFNSKTISDDWKRFMEDRKYYTNLKQEVESKMVEFSQRIKGHIEEVFDDISMIMSYSFNFNIKAGDTTDYKFAYNLTIRGIGVALGVLAATNIWHPGGWVLTGVVVVLELIGNLFDSKQKREKKAKQKLIDGILPHIEENEKKVKDEIVKVFTSNVQEVEKQLNMKLDYLIEGITDIIEVLKSIQTASQEAYVELNKIFVYRILEHFNLAKNEDNIFSKEQFKILRDYKKDLLKIQTTMDIKEKQKQEIKKVLQTNVEIVKM
ncbi:Hypothetical protein Ccan_08070 [Capnocytophaga canimorsus Cc5]|uniref:GTPase n=1 Tax=Capnocytophaga canimorsus (strain 5) TaxID=860228 RepID=F9YTZ1_CAPCC|nr:GTPase [Capnocytophaga canimorsus]AEK22925.1 Hypothetical protein Ccan_08070 [Capnocytophaga canimorsus Cc5]